MRIKQLCGNPDISPAWRLSLTSQQHVKEHKQLMKLAWRSFMILASCFIMTSFFRASTSALAVDIMRDFQVGGGFMSVMSSAFFYSYGFIQLPAGIMADRWGTRKITTFFLLLGALGGFVFSFAQNVAIATIGRIIMGMGMGMVFVPSLKVLLAWFPHDRYAMSVGLYLSVGAMGMLAASFPLTSLSALIGWRGSMAVASILTASLAGLVWMYIRNTPEEMGFRNVSSRTDDLPLAKHSIRMVMWQIVGCRDYWMLCIWLFTIYGTFYSLTSLWAGPYFGQGYGLDSNGMGLMLFMLAAGGIISPSVAGMLASHWKLPKRTILMLASGGATISLAPLLIAYPVVPNFLLPILCFTLGFFYGGFGCIAMSRIQEMFPSNIMGTATGLANLFSYAGSTILQLSSGIFMEIIASQAQYYEIQHYASMFSIFMLSTLLALCCIFICEKDAIEAA